MNKHVLNLAVIAALTTSTASLALTTRIVGGVETRPGTYPWMTSLHAKGGAQFCGASLIDKNWLLTAAHCVEQESAARIEAVIGNYDLNRPDPGEQTIAIKRILVHPRRSQGEDYDIALLELEQPASGAVIRPVTPALSESLPPGTLLTVLGWGNLSASGASFPERLHQVQVPLMDQQACKQAYPSDITDNMLCAGLPEGGKDSCQGDSGGPLVHQKNSQWFQVGIVSWGDGCAQPGAPGVYARVAAFSDWISQTLSSADGNPPPATTDPAATIDLPQGIDFTAWQGEPDQQELTLHNPGSAPVSLLSLTIDGPGFSVADNGCGLPIEAGGQCSVTLNFTPVDGNPASATLSLALSNGQQTDIELAGESLYQLSIPAGMAESDPAGQLTWWSNLGSWQSDGQSFQLDTGTIPQGSQIFLETLVTGPGSLQFDFGLPDDAADNSLIYLVDGQVVRSIRGGGQRSNSHRTELGAGEHRISWVYEKNYPSSGTLKIDKLRLRQDGQAAQNPARTELGGSGSSSPWALLTLFGMTLLRKRRIATDTHSATGGIKP